MRVLDALYINSGGGKVLLDYLIKNILSKEIDFFFLLDNRVKGCYPEMSFFGLNIGLILGIICA